MGRRFGVGATVLAVVLFGSINTARAQSVGVLLAPGGDFSHAIPDTVIRFVAWDGTQWASRIEGSRFVLAPAGDFSRAHTDGQLKYMAPDGAKWQGSIIGKKFVAMPGSNIFKTRSSDSFDYVNWDGTTWMVRLQFDAPAPATQPAVAGGGGTVAATNAAPGVSVRAAGPVVGAPGVAVYAPGTTAYAPSVGVYAPGVAAQHQVSVNAPGVTVRGGAVNGAYVSGGAVNGAYVSGGAVNGAYVSGGVVHSTVVTTNGVNGATVAVGAPGVYVGAPGVYVGAPGVAVVAPGAYVGGQEMQVNANVTVNGGAQAYASAPQGNAAMSDEDCDGMVAAIGNEGFSEGKLNVLSTAASERWFAVGCVIKILGEFAFSESKLQALRSMAPHIWDRNNNYKIVGAFTFSADKDKAKSILR